MKNLRLTLLKTTFRPGLSVRLHSDFGLQFIISSPEKSSPDCKSSLNESIQVEKAMFVFGNGVELVLNVKADCLTPRKASKCHLPVERHEGTMKVEAIFHYFKNQFKNTQG